MDNNDKLKQYIDSMKQNGMSEEVIIENLKKVGWEENQINNALYNSNMNFDIPIPKDNLIEELDIKLDKKAGLLFFLNKMNGYSLVWIALILYIFNVGYYKLEVGNYYIIGAIVLLIVFILTAFIVSKLEYKYYSYSLTKNGFQKSRGIISKYNVTIPYNKIQNIDVFQGIPERILKLYKLKIQTAGMGISTAEASLPGLTKEESERLKAELLKRSKLNI